MTKLWNRQLFHCNTNQASRGANASGCGRSKRLRRCSRVRRRAGFRQVRRRCPRGGAPQSVASAKTDGLCNVSGCNASVVYRASACAVGCTNSGYGLVTMTQQRQSRRESADSRENEAVCELAVHQLAPFLERIGAVLTLALEHLGYVHVGRAVSVHRHGFVRVMVLHLNDCRGAKLAGRRAAFPDRYVNDLLLLLPQAFLLFCRGSTWLR